MIRLTFFMALGILSACSISDSALYTGNFDTAIALKKGAGSVYRSADGKTSFRFVIREDASSQIEKDNEKEHENYRISMLQKWIGEKYICMSGYQINSVSKAQDGYIFYEGTCK
ncbi:MAG: hypothetical protein ACOYB0_02570 [Polynucleobacter sp.]